MYVLRPQRNWLAPPQKAGGAGECMVACQHSICWLIHLYICICILWCSALHDECDSDEVEAGVPRKRVVLCRGFFLQCLHYFHPRWEMCSTSALFLSVVVTRWLQGESSLDSSKDSGNFSLDSSKDSLGDSISAHAYESEEVRIKMLCTIVVLMQFFVRDGRG